MRFIKTNRIFHSIFLLMFGWIVLQVFLTIWSNNFLCALWGIVLVGITVFVYKLLAKQDYKANARKMDCFFWILMGVMFLLQLAAGYFLMCTPGTDLAVIQEVSKTAAVSGSFDNIYQNIPERVGYLARYTNNHAIFLLLAGYYRLVYLLFGDIPLFSCVFLNVLAISVSVLFVYKTAKKIFPPPGALVAFILCFFFLPYYTYTPFFYTDSLSMPFVMIPLYCYICALQASGRKKRYGYLVAFSALVFIGYSLKGSIVILLVGALVYLFLSKPVKQALACCGTVVAVFLACTVAFHTLVNTAGFTSKEELQKEQYPLTHWIMMGLNGKGGYTHSDSIFTRRAGDYDQKKAATTNMIKQRLNQYGAAGLLKHLTLKGTWTWSDGTYYIGHHIDKPVSKNFLHKFILPKGAYHDGFLFVSNAYQIMLLLLICISAVAAIKKPRITFTLLLKGLIFGVFLFFLVWETRSRYLFNFTPLFILTAVDGISTLSKCRFSKIRQRFTKKADISTT